MLKADAMKPENKNENNKLKKTKNKNNYFFYYCLGCIEVFLISLKLYKLLYKSNTKNQIKEFKEEKKQFIYSNTSLKIQKEEQDVLKKNS